MIELIQDQEITFDHHSAGVDVDVDGLHMHKRMLDKSFGGIEIKIPFNPNRKIYYPDDRSEDALHIINEIRRVLKKDRLKMTILVKKVSQVINSYSITMTEGERYKFITDSAQTFASHMGINEKIQKVIEDKILGSFKTEHFGEDGYEYTITQNLTDKNVKISGRKIRRIK